MMGFWLALGGVIVAVILTVIAKRLERHPARAMRRYVLPSIWVASIGASVAIGTTFFLILAEMK